MNKRTQLNAARLLEKETLLEDELPKLDLRGFDPVPAPQTVGADD